MFMKAQLPAASAALTLAVSTLLSALLLSGCSSSKDSGAGPGAPGGTSGTNAAKPPASSSATSPKPNDDGTLPSGVGVEKEKPAAGKGNVQGKVLYNGKPAAGVEVKLAEKFNQFMGKPDGETFVTKTDAGGEYLIKDVTPRVYEGLLVKVFDTPYFVFATSGIISNAKYKIEADKTYFAPDTNLFKSDLKLLSPKAAAKVGPSGIEVKWAPYPDTAYYKLSINADSSSGAKTEYDYINKRVDGTSFTLDKPLSPGEYSCKVVAYNAGDIKLAQSADDIKFSVK